MFRCFLNMVAFCARQCATKAALPIILLGASVAADARYHVELESTYLGNGWFRYRLQSQEDPFFLFHDVGYLGLEFPGFAEFASDPPNWASTNRPAIGQDPDHIGWQVEDCGHVACQTQPYERVFFARSDKQHFRQIENAFVGTSFSLVGGYHGWATTINLVAALHMRALAPCDAHQTNGSATNVLHRFAIITLPDPKIKALVYAGHDVHGVTFDYPEASTVRLEATRDFRNWTNIAYIYGIKGETTWSTNTSLKSFGEFFRLRLIAEGHALTLPPLQGGAGLATAAEPRSRWNSEAPLVRCRARGKELEVEINGQTNSRHIVRMTNRSMTVLQTREVYLVGNSATVLFDTPINESAVISVEPAR